MGLWGVLSSGACRGWPRRCRSAPVGSDRSGGRGAGEGPRGHRRTEPRPGPLLLLHGRNGGGCLPRGPCGGLLALLGVGGGLAGEALGPVEVGVLFGEELAALLFADSQGCVAAPVGGLRHR